MDFDYQSIAKSTFLSGFLGSLVALKFSPGDSVVERLCNLGAGSVCAGFAAPVAIDWVGVHSQSMHSLISFVVGMFGLSMAAAIYKAIRDVPLAEIAKGWLGRKG